MAITSRVTKQVSSQVTKRNPRPRKYASQAERQAAYRARNVMLEFRAEPKTADNINKIADTLGYPRSDVLLSMVKFALTNHDWARFGLTHKTIPTYKENPMQSWMIVNKQTGEAVLETYNKDILSKLNTEKYEAIPALKYLVALNKKIKENPTMKPASPAQLAARKRFAEMARSGAFKKASKRKANPSTYDPYASRDNLAEYRTKTDEQLRYIMKDAGEAAKAMRGHSPKAEEKYLDQVNDASTVLYERKQKAAKRKTNPTDIHLAGNYYGKVSKDGTGSFWTYVVNRVKEVNPDGSLYETDDVVGDFKAKHYVSMKGAINALDKYKAKLSGVKRNPAKKTVSQKISQLVHEGYPQRQAVAVALSEQRAGKVKRNPMHQYTVLHRGTANVAGQVTASGPQDAKQKVAAKLGIPTLAYLVAKKTNPAKVKYRNLATDLKGEQRVGYSVHLASQPGHHAIAWFSKKADAVKVAQEAADRTGKDLAVSRVQNYFGAM